jgi:hypothetical protein
VAGSCEYGNEPSGSGATELVSEQCHKCTLERTETHSNIHAGYRQHRPVLSEGRWGSVDWVC